MSYLYRLFIKGLFTVLPVALSLYLLYWIISSVESLLNHYVVSFLVANGYVQTFPGIGILAAVLFMMLIGFLMIHIVSDRLSRFFEILIGKIPLIKSVYRPLKDLMQLFAKKPGQSMQRVVLVNLPAMNINILGLVTRDNFNDLPDGSIPEDHLAVFAPGSYFFGGVTLLVPKNQVKELDIPVEHAVKLAITGWIQGDLNGSEHQYKKLS
jgi:uncharacterized membrane protein